MLRTEAMMHGGAGGDLCIALRSPMCPRELACTQRRVHSQKPLLATLCVQVSILTAVTPGRVRA